MCQEMVLMRLSGIFFMIRGAWTFLVISFLQGYPVLPWIGIITLGYCFGKLYTTDFDATREKKMAVNYREYCDPFVYHSKVREYLW